MHLYLSGDDELRAKLIAEKMGISPTYATRNALKELYDRLFPGQPLPKTQPAG